MTPEKAAYPYTVGAAEKRLSLVPWHEEELKAAAHDAKVEAAAQEPQKLLPSRKDAREAMKHLRNHNEPKKWCKFCRVDS